MMRRTVVGVMGSGSHPHEEKSEPLGRWLATTGVHLLTGGGGGVMDAVSRAFAQVQPRDGLVLGVLPGGDAPGYPNPWVELAIQTHLPRRGDEGADPLSRNHINVLTSDVLVALPGSAGTASEVQLAVRYGRPIAAFLDHPDQIPDLPGAVLWTPSLAEIQRFVLEHISPGTSGPHGGD